MFIEGQSYSRRRDIHEKYGGQQQGGIIAYATAVLLSQVSSKIKIFVVVSPT